MTSTVLGIFLIVIGLIALGFGIGGGIVTMILDLRRRARDEAAAGGLDVFPSEAIKALTEFLKALAAAPQWLALAILGLVLIVYGSALAF
jgi:hypothetical protein